MKNWPKACFGQKFWETRIQIVLDWKQIPKVFLQKSQFVFFWLKKLENNQNKGQMEKKVLLSETLKSELFLYWAFLSIKVRLDRKRVH